jgi:hypothetical protein
VAHLARQRESGTFADVQIRIEGQCLKAHGCILRSNSVVWNSIADSEAETSSISADTLATVPPPIDLPGTTTAQLQIMLDFLYAGKVPTAADLSGEELASTLSTACKFQLDRMVAVLSDEFASLLRQSLMRDIVQTESYSIPWGDGPVCEQDDMQDWYRSKCENDAPFDSWGYKDSWNCPKCHNDEVGCVSELVGERHCSGCGRTNFLGERHCYSATCDCRYDSDEDASDGSDVDEYRRALDLERTLCEYTFKEFKDDLRDLPQAIERAVQRKKEERQNLAPNALHVLLCCLGALPLKQLHDCCIAFLNEFYNDELRSLDSVKELLLAHPPLMVALTDGEMAARAAKRQRTLNQ